MPRVNYEPGELEVMVTKDVKRYLVRARKWIGSFDRSVFGKFAAPNKQLVPYVAYRLFALDNIEKEFTGDTHFDEVRLRLLGSPHMTKEHTEVQAEYCFWDDARFNTFAWGGAFRNNGLVDFNDPVEDGEYKSRFFRLYKNPTFIRYFEAGIWDTDFIARCVADDVDASLALTLYTHNSTAEVTS